MIGVTGCRPAASPSRPAASPSSSGAGVSVAFQGSAALVGYYAGVAQLLLEKQLLVPGVTAAAGLSGGAYTLTLAHLGLSGPDIVKFWADVYASAGRMPKSSINTIGQVALQQTIPKDISKLQGKLHIAVSQLDASRTDLNNSASWVISSWDSKADLISTLLATDYLPCVVGSTTYTILRNNPVIDGGYANGFKELCADAPAACCIRVGSWHVAGPHADGICDKRCGAQRLAAGCKAAERNGSVPTRLHPAAPLVDQWTLRQVQDRCPMSEWAARGAPFPLPDFVPQNSTAVDIHPGKYNPLPEWPTGSGRRMLACEWQNFALSPPAAALFPAFLNVSYSLGYADAAAWHAATAAKAAAGSRGRS